MADDGKVKSDNFRLLGAFDSISCGAGVDGSWAPGAATRVAGYVSEPGSLDALRVTIEGSTLHIERADPKSSVRVDVEAKSPELKSIELDGDAAFCVRGLDAKAFSCSAADHSTLWAVGKAGEAHASARGHGVCALDKLDAAVCSFKACDDGRGALSFSDAGSVTLTGRAQSRATGSGQLWAKIDGESFLEIGPDIRIGKVEADGKATMSLRVHGEVEVGDVEKAKPSKGGPSLH